MGEREQILVRRSTPGEVRSGLRAEPAGFAAPEDAARSSKMSCQTASQLCVRRVKQRARRGGHDVPEEDVIRRFYRSKQNFWSVYRHEVDRWYLYYNAEDSFQEVAMGEPSGYTITDEALFELFMNDIDA